MRHSRLLLLLLTLACSPVPAPRTAPATPRAPAPTATAAAGRVVLLSFDGLSADGLAKHLPLPGFDQLRQSGAAARVVPVNPTATSSTHASILTGAEPQRHGIVANRFHLPGTPPEATARGLEVELDAETLVEAARRQGKRVGAVPFPTVDGRSGTRRADFGFAWTRATIPPRTVTLTRTDFHREWVPPTWTGPASRRPSFSPVMRARLEWVAGKRLRTDVDVIAYDTTDDRSENYDSYFAEVDGREVTPDANGWFAVARQGPAGLFGSWSKFLRTTGSLDVTLYQGAISRTNAWPDSYRTMLDAEAGFWPGPPDETSDIDPETFAQQIARLAGFLTRAQTLTIERMEFDLLLAYQPQVDEAAHNFLGYDDQVVAAAYAAADRAVQGIGALLDPARDAFVVTGDHGYAPIEREIRMNRLLADLGYAPRWRAYASGNVAQLYRFAEPDDSAELGRRLRESGLFERVDARQPGWHRHSGDLVVWAAPGTVLSPAGDGPVAAEPDAYAQHGALNRHRELHTVLLASGRGVPAGSFADLPQTSVARFVAALLSIQPPSAAQ